MELKLSEKERMILDKDYENHEEYKYKICAAPLQDNIYQDCYREQLVSFFQMAPLMNKTVPLEEADYILYANPFARVEDFTNSVLNEIAEIAKKRKKGAEIIVCGKACNIKTLINEKYENITYVFSHFADYVGRRFEIDMHEQYVVYDDRNGYLNIWPVDGCYNKCGFCRRSYMYIPFESQPLNFLKERLDWFKAHHPEQMKYVSLRAENLTQYGIDIYHKPMLHKVIELLNSYDEIESIDLSIGMCIGEMNDDILASICKCQKITGMMLYMEAGTDRLIQLIGKKHTVSRAKEIIQIIRKYHPFISIDIAAMIGLPTEELEDILALASFILECDINFVHCNYYRYSPKHPLAAYEQLSEQVKRLHMSYLIQYIKKHYSKNYILRLCHESFFDSSKRSVARKLEFYKYQQQFMKPRIWYGATFEYFVGNDIVIKSNERYLPIEQLYEEVKRVEKQKRLTK